MSQQKYSSLSVIDKHEVNWKARVIVLNKKPLKQSSNSKRTKYQKLVLADEWGNCVDAVIYDSDIELYKEIIHQDMAYVISNAGVTIADTKYKSVFANTRYSWTINARTMVTRVDYPPKVASPFKGCFSIYNEFVVDSFTNTVVVVTYAHPPRPIRNGQTVTEYVGFDNKFNQIIFTVWNDECVTERTHSLLIDNNPVVALINFKVNKYHGLSLSSSTNSFIVTRLDHPTFMEMEQWRNENKDIIQERIGKGGSAKEKIDATSNLNLPEMSIREILDAETKKKYIIRVKAQLQYIPSSFMYICCDKCHRKTEAPFRTLFKCLNPRCNDFNFAVRRYKFCIQVEDSSGVLDVTLFGKFGETVLHFNEDDFHKEFYPDWFVPKDDINNKLEGITWKMTILKSSYNSRGEMAVSYNVDDMVDIKESSSDKEHAAINDVEPLQSSISKVLESEQGNKYSVIVEARLDDIPASFMYMCCEACHCRTDVSFDTQFRCSTPQCSTGYKHAIRRYRFCIQVHDSTGELPVIVFGKLGEMVLHKNEDEFHKQYPDRMISLDEINSNLKGKKWKMTIISTTQMTRKSYMAQDMVLLDHSESETEKVIAENSLECSDSLQCSIAPNIDDVMSVKVKIEEEEDAKRAATIEAKKK